MDLADRTMDGWTLVGGQMVQMHCLERGFTPHRATTDIDAVLDVRAHPHVLREITAHLSAIGFATDLSPAISGVNHRWRREDAVIDLLIPRHLGQTAANRGDIHGAPGLETPGAQRVLDRSEVTVINLEGRSASINRPTLLGALVGKASALLNPGNNQRHLEDFAVLASMLRPGDIPTNGSISKLELDRLNNAVGHLRVDTTAITARTSGAEEGLARLVLSLNQHEHRERKPTTTTSDRSTPAWVNRTTQT